MIKHFTYLFFLFFCLGNLHAQSPGGVSSPEIWFKSVPQTKNLQGMYVWKDFSGDSTSLRRYDSRGPLYGTEYALTRSQVRTYNFNPAMDLSEVYASKQFLINKTNLSQATIISVWGPDYGDFNQDMFLYVLNGRPGNGYIFTKDKLIHAAESGRGIFDYGKEYGKDLLYQTSDEEADINEFRERALRVTSYTRALKPATSVWGEKDKAIINIGEIFHPEYTTINNSTYNISGNLNNRSFFGYTPEFIIYNRILTPLERRMAETYLAIKYGLTLDRSYISSRGTLLWEQSRNPNYNIRITGYGRDDLSGMYQKMSTTSYEEAPYYSDDYSDLYDSFDQNNSYYQPNRYRLLVMGRQAASPIEDDKYVLYGDNDAAVATSTETGVNGIRLMQRRWLINTNMLPVREEQKKMEWITEHLDVYTEGFITKATKTGSASETSGYLISDRALLHKDGYLSWTISSSRRGPLTVKFGANTPFLTSGSHDYGYYFNQDGVVYKIVKGIRQTAAIAAVAMNTKIEVGKEGNTVYLRFNGYRVYNYDIDIDEADENKPYYGSILIDKYYQETVNLAGIRHGGFCDTGNNLELSYVVQRASEFLNYRSGNKSYLVIDRSGTGDFSSSDTEYIPSDEMDESRYKIIFNNIFWDTDGNGKDMFTFGYRQSNMIAITSKKDPACLEGVLQEDGQIDIKIKQGFKAFTYSLTNQDTKEEHKGTFFTDSISLKNLATGTYDLTVVESGGFNLYPKKTGDYVNKAVSSIYFNSWTNAYMEWTVSENTEAKAGMKTSATLITSAGVANVDYGLWVKEGNLFRINKNAIAGASLGTVVPGDRIRVERITNIIYYKLNDTILYSEELPVADRLAYNYAMAEVTAGGIYNLNFNRMNVNATWLVTDNLALEKSSGDSMSQTFTLTPDCDRQQVTPEPAPEANTVDNRFIVSSQPGTYKIKASLNLDTPEAVTFIVHNLSGMQINKVNTPPQDTPSVELNVGVTGIYNVKAITAKGEYSEKIIVQ